MHRDLERFRPEGEPPSRAATEAGALGAPTPRLMERARQHATIGQGVLWIGGAVAGVALCVLATLLMGLHVVFFLGGCGPLFAMLAAAILVPIRRRRLRRELAALGP